MSTPDLNEFSQHKIHPSILATLDKKRVHYKPKGEYSIIATEEERARWAAKKKRRSGLVSDATRRQRRNRASMRPYGGKAKHMMTFLSTATGNPRMAPPRKVLNDVVHEPYEGRATARRPWTVRAERRIQNRRARAGRKAAR